MCKYRGNTRKSDWVWHFSSTVYLRWQKSFSKPQLHKISWSTPPPPLISRAACSNRSHRKNLTCRVSKGTPWKPRNKDHDILFYYSRFLKEKKTATLLLTVTSILQSERVLSDLDRQLGMAMQQWGWNSLVVHQVTEIIESWLQLQYYNNTSLLYCTKGPFFDVQQRRS